MSRSVAVTLDTVAPYLPPALVAASAVVRIRRLADRLPVSLAEAFGFECRLSGDPQVDFHIGLISEAAVRPGRELLASHALGDLRRENPVWTRVGLFCQRWIDSFEESVCELCLEFEGPHDGIPNPSVMLGLARPTYDHTLTIVNALAPETLTPGVMRHLARSFDGLPSTGLITDLCFKFPREQGGLRIVVELAEADLCEYLRAIGWSGQVDTVAATVDELRTDGGPFVGRVNIDIGERFAPQIGLEYSLERYGQLSNAFRQRSFFDRLAAIGLAESVKLDALTAWSGLSLERLGDDEWLNAVVRIATHIKIVVTSGRPSSAKVYLSVLSQATSATSLAEITVLENSR